MTLMLGLSFALGSVAMFAQDQPAEKKMEKKKKSSKKKKEAKPEEKK
jgi:hypothetical protein